MNTKDKRQSVCPSRPANNHQFNHIYRPKCYSFMDKANQFYTSELVQVVHNCLQHYTYCRYFSILGLPIYSGMSVHLTKTLFFLLLLNSFTHTVYRKQFPHIAIKSLIAASGSECKGSSTGRSVYLSKIFFLFILKGAGTKFQNYSKTEACCSLQKALNIVMFVM